MLDEQACAEGLERVVETLAEGVGRFEEGEVVGEGEIGSCGEGTGLTDSTAKELAEVLGFADE